MKRVAFLLALSAATASHAASVPAVTVTAASAATIMAYKRDPVPIFDDAGSKLRDAPKASLPKANTPEARVVDTKPGFVAIILDGKPAWLRLTSVDYVGDLPAPPCGKSSVQLALAEEDGVERSLGLGCTKGK